RQREDDAGRDGFTGGADRLNDIVLEDRRLADFLEDGDREHGHRNRRRHGQTGLEREVHGCGAEDDAGNCLEHDRFAGESGRRLRGWYVGLELCGLGAGGMRRCRHAFVSPLKWGHPSMEPGVAQLAEVIAADLATWSTPPHVELAIYGTGEARAI